MKYICNPCNYETDRIDNYTRHQNTSKHKNKCNEHNFKNNPETKTDDSLEDVKKYKCPECDFKTKHESSYYRHRFKCAKNDKNDKNDKIDSEGENSSLEKVIKKNEKLIKDKIDKLEKDNQYLKSLVESAGNITKTSVSALSYVIKNYPDAPSIESLPLPDYKMIKSGNHDLTTTVASYFKDNLLEKYLGEKLIEYYKTANPEKQPFWGTDVSRSTFVTRTTNKNNESEWLYDMKGTCMGESIIDPMLDHINTENLIYIDKVPSKLKQLSVADGNEVLEVQRFAYKITNFINSGNLKQGIIKEISPHFYLNSRKSQQGGE